MPRDGTWEVSAVHLTCRCRIPIWQTQARLVLFCRKVSTHFLCLMSRVWCTIHPYCSHDDILTLQHIIIFTHRRIDFREFVRDLHAVYKIRIWMQPVDVTNSFRPNEIASRALASGFLIQSPGSIQSLQTRSPLTYMPDGMNNANTTILHHPNVAVNGSGTGGAYPMRSNLNQGQHSLRSCPPSALGTYPGPSPVLIQNQGYYGARVKQQPSPYFLTGK